jgi:hypothetical protein
MLHGLKWPSLQPAQPVCQICMLAGIWSPDAQTQLRLGWLDHSATMHLEMHNRSGPPHVTFQPGFPDALTMLPLRGLAISTSAA